MDRCSVLRELQKKGDDGNTMTFHMMTENLFAPVAGGFQNLNPLIPRGRTLCFYILCSL